MKMEEKHAAKCVTSVFVRLWFFPPHVRNLFGCIRKWKTNKISSKRWKPFSSSGRQLYQHTQIRLWCICAVAVCHSIVRLNHHNWQRTKGNTKELHFFTNRNWWDNFLSPNEQIAGNCISLWSEIIYLVISRAQPQNNRHVWWMRSAAPHRTKLSFIVFININYRHWNGFYTSERVYACVQIRALSMCVCRAI